MNNFDVIIGIEIHIELNTKTKMFSAAANDFDAAPNTNVSPIDLAYPGTLPSVNKQAVVKAIQMCKALQMDIDETLYFDRKHYSYHDLPKGYQITQNLRPIGSNGKLKIVGDKEVTIERIHLEEDTAKTINRNGDILLNYNRAGVPLIEIVTDPVIKTAEQAASYVDNIRKVAKALDISDAKMEEGSLRADINISLRPHGQKEFGTKVEIKNLNSISNIQKSIEFEIALQTKKILAGEVILQETKRFDEETKKTVTMRVKTGATDYRFFEEPNILPIHIGKEFIDSVKISELPWEMEKRYRDANLTDEYIEKLTSNLEQASFFDSIEYANKDKLAKVFFAEIVSLANSKNVSIKELEIDPKQVSIMMNYLEDGTISGKHIKTIIPLLSSSNDTVDAIMDKNGMKQISDPETIKEYINSIIKENSQFIDNNRDRKERVAKFILGQLMKITKGQANPIVSNKIVNEILGE